MDPPLGLRCMVMAERPSTSSPIGETGRSGETQVSWGPMSIALLIESSHLCVCVCVRVCVCVCARVWIDSVVCAASNRAMDDLINHCYNKIGEDYQHKKLGKFDSLFLL